MQIENIQTSLTAQNQYVEISVITIVGDVCIIVCFSGKMLKIFRSHYIWGGRHTYMQVDMGNALRQSDSALT